MSLLETAVAYCRAGLAILPAHPTEKRPLAGRGQHGKNAPFPVEGQVRSQCAAAEAICILCGRVSGHVECVDFDDAGSAFPAWREALEAAHPGLATRLVMERSPSGGIHVIYRASEPIPGSHHLAVDESGTLLIETRGEGALFLCDPSPGYQLQQGSFTNFPRLTPEEREAILSTARALNRGELQAARKPAIPRPALAPVSLPADYVATPYGAKVLDDEAAHVRTAPKGVRNKTLNDAAFKVGQLVAGGQIPQDDARAVLMRAALDAGLAEHEVEATLTSGLSAGFRSPRVPEPRAPEGPAVDLSGIAARAAQVADGIPLLPAEPIDQPEDDDDDLPEDDCVGGSALEPLPHELLDAPGFIHDAVEWGMAANLYPNRPLIFAATLSTLATLTARKITLAGQTWPNIYTIAVALSGTGKDAGNLLSTSILRSAGLGQCAQFEFGSAEAIEDAFIDVSPAILWVCDEFDEWIGATKNENNRGGTSGNKVRRMLQLFSQSKTVIYRRLKARQSGKNKDGEASPLEEIHMPHLSIYGTCTPKGFFSAFNERVASGGFLGRMLIFEGDRRGLRHRPTASLIEPPEALVKAARFWAQHPCGPGDAMLASVMPNPKPVPFGPGAEDLDDERARVIDQILFPKHERIHDEIGGSIYARTAEYARKLALLRAASANPFNPVACTDSVNWGWELSLHQSKRLISLVGRHSADNPFQELCLKILNRLRDEQGNPVGRSELLRLTRVKKADFDAAIEALTERREIQAVQVRTKTKTADGYRLRVRQKLPR